MGTDENGLTKYVEILGQLRKLDFTERHYGVGFVCCLVQIKRELKGD
jgi:hypothetical protein